MSKTKVSTRPKTFSAQDIYVFYAEKYLQNNPECYSRYYCGKHGKIFNKDGELVMSYKKFKEILTHLNITIGDFLIDGYKLKLTHGLGYLYLARMEANPNNRNINYNETKRIRKQLAEQGKNEKVTVYYTEDEYLRLKYHKPSYTRNLMFYQFSPASGPSGFKLKFSHSYNKTRRSLYPFIPLKRV